MKEQREKLNIKSGEERREKRKRKQRAKEGEKEFIGQKTKKKSMIE